MKKRLGITVLIIALLCLCGCNRATNNEVTEIKESDNVYVSPQKDDKDNEFVESDKSYDEYEYAINENSHKITFTYKERKKEYYTYTYMTPLIDGIAPKDLDDNGVFANGENAYNIENIKTIKGRIRII